MIMMCLLGINEDNDIVFAKPEVKTNGEFTCCFDLVTPFIMPDEEDLEERAQEYLEEMDAEFKWKFCEDHDCKPSEMAESLTEDEQFELVYDTSLYPNFFTDDNGNEWHFEISSCGQHDIREEGMKYLVVPEKAYTELMRLWDNYHLKTLPTNEMKTYRYIMSSLQMDDYEEECRIKDMIEKFEIDGESN
jgi:hypothetical protein